MRAIVRCTKSVLAGTTGGILLALLALNNNVVTGTIKPDAPLSRVEQMIQTGQCWRMDDPNPLEGTGLFPDSVWLTLSNGDVKFYDDPHMVGAALDEAFGVRDYDTIDHVSAFCWRAESDDV